MNVISYYCIFHLGQYNRDDFRYIAIIFVSTIHAYTYCYCCYCFNCCCTRRGRSSFTFDVVYSNYKFGKRFKQSETELFTHNELINGEKWRERERVWFKLNQQDEAINWLGSSPLFPLNSLILFVVLYLLNNYSRYGVGSWAVDEELLELQNSWLYRKESNRKLWKIQYISLSFQNDYHLLSSSKHLHKTIGRRNRHPIC